MRHNFSAKGHNKPIMGVLCTGMIGQLKDWVDVMGWLLRCLCWLYEVVDLRPVVLVPCRVMAFLSLSLAGRSLKHLNMLYIPIYKISSVTISAQSDGFKC